MVVKPSLNKTIKSVKGLHAAQRHWLWALGAMWLLLWVIDFHLFSTKNRSLIAREYVRQSRSILLIVALKLRKSIVATRFREFLIKVATKKNARTRLGAHKKCQSTDHVQTQPKSCFIINIFYNDFLIKCQNSTLITKIFEYVCKVDRIYFLNYLIIYFLH